MINGNVNEFIDGLYYGDERIFMYKGQKFFVQGFSENGYSTIYLARWEPPCDDYIWVGKHPYGAYDVEAFLAAPIWDGRTFWEAEKEMEWVDD